MYLLKLNKYYLKNIFLRTILYVHMKKKLQLGTNFHYESLLITSKVSKSITNNKENH